MQKVLYVHIGTEKTGSTALQSVSGINRVTLMKHGILYPKTPGDRNHIRLAIFAADGKSLNLRRLAGLVPDDSYKLFKTQFGDELRAEVLASQCSRIYLSNEHLSSRIFSARAVTRLANLLRPLADAVKIVVYLRPQPELFLSSYSTALKAGLMKAFEPPTDPQDLRYNYERKLALWADGFDEKNLIVRVYDRNTLVGGDVVKDFFSIMGYEPGSDINIPTAANVRLDHVSLQFLQEFNKHVPTFLEKSVNPDRGDIAIALANRSMGPGMAIQASTLRDIAKLYEKSNAQIARRFLGRPDGKLFAEVEYKDNESGEVLTAGRAIEISAHLWRWKQRDYIKVKLELARVKAKLNLPEITSPKNK